MRNLLGAVLIAGIAGSTGVEAQTQNLGMPSPASVWSGAYVGASAGYLQSGGTSGVGATVFQNQGLGSLATTNAFAASASRGTDGLSAILGGGGIGYNWQFGAVVVGLEADLHVSSRSRDTRQFASPIAGFPAETVVGTNSVSDRLNYVGTVRTRLGYTLLDDLLVYVTGGLAYGERDSRLETRAAVVGPFLGPAAAPLNSSIGRTGMEIGYVVGGGLEYRLDANWSVKADASYYDLGRTRSAAYADLRRIDGPTFGIAALNRSADNRGVVARVGVNYRFDWF